MQIHELNTIEGKPGGTDYLAIDTGFDTAKVSANKLLEPKLNRPVLNNQYDNGAAGQLLRSKGDGSTEWADYGLPTDAQTAQAINDWLDAHPEATTTVQDQSLDYKKIINGTLGFVTPEMYGAKGDGVTDDTQAIRDAVNSGCSVIIFSPKTYLIDPASFISYAGYTSKVGINIPSGVSIIGFGATIQVKQSVLDTNYVVFASDNFRSIAYDANIAWQSNISISGIKIDGNAGNLSNEKSLTGITFYKCNDTTIENVEMVNLCGTDGGGYGLILAFCNRAIFRNSSINRSSRSNIYCWESQYVTCENLTLNGSYDRDCVTCSANETLALQKSIIYFNNCHMEHLYNTGTHVARFPKDVDAVMENCTLIGNSNVDGIAIPRSAGSVNLVVRNCSVKDCTVGVNATGQNTYTRLVLENNSISGDDAINLLSINELQMRGNFFESVNPTPNQNTNVSHCTKAFVSGNVFKGFVGIVFNTSDIKEIINNAFIGFTASPYWAILAGDGYVIFMGNYADDATKYARVYCTGKAIGNHIKVESTTLDTSQYNS